MMMIIWDHVLKTFLGLKQLRELKGNQTIPLVITVKDVYDKLLRFTPTSNPKCVEQSAVKTALLGFVEMGVATLTNSHEEKFEVRFRKHKGRLLDWLFEKIEKPEKTKPTATLDQFVEKEQQKDKKPVKT